MHKVGAERYMYKDKYIYDGIQESTTTTGMIVMYVNGKDTHCACAYRFGSTITIDWIKHDSDAFNISYENHTWKFDTGSNYGHLFIYSGNQLYSA